MSGALGHLMTGGASRFAHDARLTALHAAADARAARFDDWLTPAPQPHELEQQLAELGVVRRSPGLVGAPVLHDARPIGERLTDDVRDRAISLIARLGG